MNGSAALSLFKEVFSETADCHINYDNALAIEDALHQLYIKSEEDGTYWVAACQAVEDVRIRTIEPYTGIIRLKRGEVFYVRYDTDETIVDIEKLGLDEEVYGIDRKTWDKTIANSVILLPENTIYGSPEEAKAGLATRRGDPS